MAFLRKVPNSPYWYACFRSPDGTRTNQSTKIRASDSTKTKALAVAEKMETRMGVISREKIEQMEAKVKPLLRMYSKNDTQLYIQMCDKVREEAEIEGNQLAVIVFRKLAERKRRESESKAARSNKASRTFFKLSAGTSNLNK